MFSDPELNSNVTFQAEKSLVINEYKMEGESPDTTWSRLCQNMANDGTWACDIFVHGTALFLKKDIHLTSDKHTISQPWSTISGTFKSNKKRTCPLYVAYLTNTHFESLHPLETTKKSTNIFDTFKRLLSSPPKEDSNKLPCLDKKRRYKVTSLFGKKNPKSKKKPDFKKAYIFLYTPFNIFCKKCNPEFL